MKLEVGMYVRTLEGIMKAIEIKEDRAMTRFVNEDGNVYFINDLMTNPSYNIIDLIEVGDFITLGENNYPLQVRNIWEFAEDINIELSNGAKFEDLHDNKDFKIYSIVTKEQFESMAYKVVE